MFGWRWVAAIVAIWAGLQNSVWAEEVFPPAPTNERVVSVVGDFGDLTGNLADIVVTIMSPSGPGPFPVVILNHGSSVKSSENEKRIHRSFSIFYFLSRGYMVALPMMRGYGGSDGKQLGNGCNQEAVGLANAKDIAAVVDYMRYEPHADTSHIVVAGQSFGGWNTLAFGAGGHSEVRGLINFNGGVNISNCRLMLDALSRGARDYGARTKLPSLWFYGDNDSIFPPPVWRAMFESYTSAGAKAELVPVGTFMTDSHQLMAYPEGLWLAAPRLDAFLIGIGMPGKEIYPDYLPKRFPPATGYASVSDVEAVPYINEEGRKQYRDFLATPMPRVFFVTAKGGSASFFGGADPLGRGLSACEKQKVKCVVYATDNDVVWSRPTPSPPPSHFAAIGDVAAIPFIREEGRAVFQKFLSLSKPKAFVIAPDGGVSAAAMGDDPLATAMSGCLQRHKGCAYYAVDNDVVWAK